MWDIFIAVQYLYMDRVMKVVHEKRQEREIKRSIQGQREWLRNHLLIVTSKALAAESNEQLQ